jgi:sulfofructose kinase
LSPQTKGGGSIGAGATVACIGIAVIDHIYHVAQLPNADRKLRARAFHESGGGMAAGAATAVACLGGQASWFGRVGADNKGAAVLSELRKQGVATNHAQQIEGASTSHSAVMVDGDGHRAIVACAGDGLDDDASWLPLDVIADHDVVLADIRWEEGALASLTAARARGRPAVLDADATTSALASQLVAAASHAIFSEQGLENIYAAGTIDEGLRLAAQHTPFVAVTLGAQGVAWVDHAQNVQHLEAPVVEARETLGAGDLFHGAFALALAEKHDEAAALRFAVAAASLKCTRTGGWQSFPKRHEVEVWLQGHDALS